MSLAWLEQRNRRRAWMTGTLTLLLLLAMGLSLVSGVVPVSPRKLLDLAREPAALNPLLQTILWEVRLPRILLGALAGASLAATGAAVQGLFRNPLADPALIGVSSGAALVAAASMVFGRLLVDAALLRWLVPPASFVGGLLATHLVVRLGTGVKGTSVPLMLLAGIAINAIAIAGVGVFSYLSDLSELRGIAFWSLGSFADADWIGVGVASLLPLVTWLLWRRSRELDAVVLGESEARYLGVDVDRLKQRVILLTALGVGLTVSMAGIIAFIGLVVPHLIRLLAGSSHGFLLPASALLGALLVVLADLLARILVAPAELPVGIVTSLLGGPFFIYLIVREKRKLDFQ